MHRRLRTVSLDDLDRISGAVFPGAAYAMAPVVVRFLPERQRQQLVTWNRSVRNAVSVGKRFPGEQIAMAMAGKQPPHVWNQGA